MNENGYDQRKTEYERDLSRLRSFRDSRNLDSLEKFADEIEKKWSQIDGVSYFDLLLNVCNLLSSYSFNDYRRQISLAQKYAALALAKSDEIPLEIELKLLLFLPPDMEYQQGEREEDWAKQRTTRTRLWLRGWQRLSKEIDPDFDVDDLPKRNIAPPPGAASRAGVAPEHIKDPILRAEYEAAIAENEQKAQKYNWQYKLRRLDQMFSEKAEQSIVRAYSKPPFDLEELRRFLDTYITDEKKRLEILDAVRQNMPNA